MNKRELINMLLYDVALEHSAIVQYLYHIFLIQNAEITSEIEEIARQEMRHLKWFAQKVVQLGGQVELKRIEEAIEIGGPEWVDMLSKDVKAEEMAIEIYTKQLEMVKDDSVKRLLERVIGDENHHRLEFSELAQKAAELIPEETMESSKNSVDPKTLEVLNNFLREEYQSIINYLYQFFHTKDCNYKDLMLDLAIESMFHMGKIGERIGELGGMPDIRADLQKKPDKSLEESVRSEIAFEESAGEDYEKELKEAQDPKTKELFEFIEHQEKYHKHRLTEFLRKLNRFTIGGLREDD
ncbi:ferritin-like domain-containing protein [Thermocrinis minervae]|uniref:Bacterioferritin n=1 Tax=Thermocrinis minervae TaxID=381751 RepID=A0A1M6SI41_9AQUI|nr:ferritin-like domain-containing protein [Thermocrinis minervae]SHK44218.1 bacterioferritin [Thermocrinis minervae]